MLPNHWSRQFSTNMLMAAGSLVLRDPLEVTTPIFEGLQIIVSLSSRLTSWVNGCAPFEITGPGVYLVLAHGRHEGCDRLAANTPQRFIRIGIDPQSADDNGLDLGRIARSDCTRLYHRDITVMHMPLTPALTAIANQTLAYPQHGTSMRDMYLAGKCIELTALTMEAVISDERPAQTALSNADLERLWHARALAERHFQQPLTLHELARQVGTNVNKLSQGFRQVFGMSVFEYMQRHRLQEAHRMLSTGAYTVSEVAAFVGYAIPHFSTVFRKHYGFPPSQLGRQPNA